MAEEFRIVDIWVGTFASEAELNSYLHETYAENDAVPISHFAADQDQAFYDHDLVEAGFHASADDFAELAEKHSFASSYQDAGAEAFSSSGVCSANTILLVFGKEIRIPRSAHGPSYDLTYLGRFDCNPDVASYPLGEDGIPNQVYLLLQGDREVEFNGKPTFIVPIDSRGLVIGRGVASGDSPCLDIVRHVQNIAEIQIKIYQDQFDQWVIEDVGNNGLTRIGSEVLDSAKSLPWHGNRLFVGTLQFVWSVRLPDSAG